MKINTSSVIKAAVIGAVINAFIGLLVGGTAFLGIAAVGTVVGLLACCGGLLIPVLTGALYGYFTPGRETLADAAAGGAIAGLVAGLVYGILSGISQAVISVVQGTDVATVLGNTGVALLLSCCGAVLFGSLLGGIGGAVWTAVQGDKQF
jgi:hypothetical protein